MNTLRDSATGRAARSGALLLAPWFPPFIRLTPVHG